MSEPSEADYRCCPLCRARNVVAAQECARCGFGLSYREPPLQDASWLEKKFIEAGYIRPHALRCLCCWTEISDEARASRVCPGCGISLEHDVATPGTLLDPWQHGFDESRLQNTDTLPLRARLGFVGLGAAFLLIVCAVGWALMRWLP